MRIVLIGGQDLVAGLQIQAEFRDLQGFAGIAREHNFVRADSGQFGHHAFRRCHARVEFPDHGVIRPHVAVIEIPAHGLLHRSRRRTHVTVVEVDDRAVRREFIADRDPEIFVSRDFFGWTAGGGSGCEQRLRRTAAAPAAN